MTTTTPSSAVVPTAPVFTDTERLAFAGFLAGYSGLTRAAYALDLRKFASWGHRHPSELACWGQAKQTQTQPGGPGPPRRWGAGGGRRART